MGFNTVAFLLNDYMHELKNSPNAVVAALSYPPHNNRPEDIDHWRDLIRSVAKEHNEPMLHPQALEVLATFHADYTKFFMAGGNCIHEFSFDDVEYKTIKGVRCAVLKLPHWKQPKKS